MIFDAHDDVIDREPTDRPTCPDCHRADCADPDWCVLADPVLPGLDLYHDDNRWQMIQDIQPSEFGPCKDCRENRHQWSAAPAHQDDDGLTVHRWCICGRTDEAFLASANVVAA